MNIFFFANVQHTRLSSQTRGWDREQTASLPISASGLLNSVMVFFHWMSSSTIPFYDHFDAKQKKHSFYNGRQERQIELWSTNHQRAMLENKYQHNVEEEDRKMKNKSSSSREERNRRQYWRKSKNKTRSTLKYQNRTWNDMLHPEQLLYCR